MRLAGGRRMAGKLAQIGASGHVLARAPGKPRCETLFALTLMGKEDAEAARSSSAAQALSWSDIVEISDDLRASFRYDGRDEKGAFRRQVVHLAGMFAHIGQHAE